MPMQIYFESQFIPPRPSNAFYDASKRTSPKASGRCSNRILAGGCAAPDPAENLLTPDRIITPEEPYGILINQFFDSVLCV